MKIFSFSLTVLFVAVFTLPASAQKDFNDGPIGIFQNRGEYDDFMRGVKTAAYGEGGSRELQAMIPMLNDMVLGQEFGTTSAKYGSGNNSEFELLSDPKVRENIDMVDEQYDELQKLNAEIQKRAAERLRQLDFSDREGLLERLKEIREDANKELETLFIPEQLERLQQLRNQSRLRRRSLVDLLTSNPLKDQLDISDRQADDLREVEEEIERELQEEIKKLREKARKRILDNLNQEQQDEVERLFGDPFEFESNKDSGKFKKSNK